MNTLTKIAASRKALVAATAMAASLAATAANASPILVFGTVGTGTPVSSVATGSSTTISATNDFIAITAIDAPNVIPAGSLGTGAYLTFSATSTDTAVLGTNNNVRQNFFGTFSIYSGQNQTGTDYLSGTFTDLFEGLNNSATLVASTPPASNVTFVSDVIPMADLGLDRAVSFSFSAVTPGVTAPANGTIPSFSATVSGNFSAQSNSVPEPASMALLGAGLVALGVVRRKRR